MIKQHDRSAYSPTNARALTWGNTPTLRYSPPPSCLLSPSLPPLSYREERGREGAGWEVNR